MMKFRQYLLPTMIGFTVATPLPKAALSAEFTFHVRVEASNLSPEAAGLSVFCKVDTAANLASNDPKIAAQSVGFGYAHHKFCPGDPRSYSGVITVAFDPEPGKNPASATAYFCQIEILNNAGKTELCTGDCRGGNEFGAVQVQGLVNRITGPLVRGAQTNSPAQLQLARPRC